MDEFLIKNINAHEIEIRIGTFQKGKFNPNLSEDEYQFYQNLPILNKKSIQKKNYEISIIGNGNKVYREYNGKHELKEKLGNFDLRLMNLRISANNEFETQPRSGNKKTFQKERESLITTDQKFRFDFTKTNGKLSLEVEYLGESISKLEEIKEMVLKLYAYQLQYHFWKTVNKPVSLNHETVYYLKKGYAITEKADGSRVLLLIGEKYGFEISSTEVLPFPVLKTLSCRNAPFTFFLIDCEKVQDTYYAFDILNYCYFKIDRKDLKIRYDHLKRLVSGTQLEKQLKLKQMRMGYQNIVEEVKKVYANKYNYNIDGIIFTPIHTGYKDRSLPVLKWKPIKDLTVDFLVKINKEVELYCKDNGPKLFEKVPLTTFTKKERDEMNNKIVELSFDKKWKFYRIREDKTKEYQTSKEFTGPNYCGVCQSTKNLINHPLNLNNLNKNVYYKNIQNSHMTQMKKYNNRIKSYMINQYVNSGARVLDIAGGRGGDLMKYEKKKVGEVLLLNIDEGGLAEAKRRFPKMSFRTQLGDARKNLKIEGKFEVVSIQFAIHYMLGSKKEWETFFKNIDGVLEKGGLFMCSFLDGESVNDSLEKNGEVNYLGNDNSSSIFKLERLYEGKMKDLGQEIKVISENFGEMNEYLVNVNFLIKYFEKKGYELLENKFFKEIETTNSLSKGEKGYADLERFLVFRKK